MRAMGRALGILGVGLGLVACAGSNADLRPAGPSRGAREAVTSVNLEAARELDQQGVRAYAAGHYRDAIAFFRGARLHGGPASELWNIFRCHERLDDAEDAAQVLSEYVAAPGVSLDERAQAQRELNALRTRPSLIVVASSPSGATVSIDGQATSGATPLSSSVNAGTHTVTVRLTGYAPRAIDVEARLGRAIVVDVVLEKS